MKVTFQIVKTNESDSRAKKLFTFAISVLDILYILHIGITHCIIIHCGIDIN